MAAHLKEVPKFQPKPWVIESLRDTLAASERGEVVAVGICYVDLEGNVHTDFSNQANGHGGKNLAAAATALLHRITRYWLDD